MKKQSQGKATHFGVFGSTSLPEKEVKKLRDELAETKAQWKELQVTRTCEHTQHTHITHTHTQTYSFSLFRARALSLLLSLSLSLSHTHTHKDL
jgi:hypothetical protein